MLHTSKSCPTWPNPETCSLDRYLRSQKKRLLGIVRHTFVNLDIRPQFNYTKVVTGQEYDKEDSFIKSFAIMVEKNYDKRYGYSLIVRITSKVPVQDGTWQGVSVTKMGVSGEEMGVSA